MKCVVTGGAGYIGSVTAAVLRDAGHDVIVADSLITGHADAVPDGCVLIEVDVRDREAITEVVTGADAVLHFAARSLVAESVAHPDVYWDANLGGTRSLLAAIAAAGVPRLVVSSTAAVYGDPAEVPIVETATTEPTNPYGASKLAMDAEVSASVSDALGAVSLRYFNVAGAHGRFGERHDPETHIIPVVLQSLLRGTGEPVRVFGTDWDTPDGSCVRDYIHVLDLAEAHVRSLGIIRPGHHEVINLGSGTGYSVLEVIAAVERVTGVHVPWTAAARRPGDPAILLASVVRARELLGWQPTRSLEQMVSDAWEFLRG